MKIVDHNGQLNKSSPDSGYPGENGDLSNGFYENLPFHGMKQQPQQPHKQVSLDPLELVLTHCLDKSFTIPLLHFFLFLKSNTSSTYIIQAYLDTNEFFYNFLRLFSFVETEQNFNVFN